MLIRSKVIPVLMILLLLLIPFWYYYNNNFVLTIEESILNKKTENFIKNNLKKEDSIMAQPGYNVKLIYQTGRRMVGLYSKPEKLPYLIDYYNTDYIIFGRIYTEDIHHYSIKTVEYIKNNPDKFELIATVQEDYSEFYGELDPIRTDEVYIYKVKKQTSFVE